MPGLHRVQDFMLEVLLVNNTLRIYNHSHNILRLFDVLPNFPFTKSETMDDYYL